jgi:hypothetical protein
MLVWGSKGEVADLGPQESRHYPACEKERSFRLMLQYRVSHISYIFKWVTEKQYGPVCAVCHRGSKRSRGCSNRARSVRFHGASRVCGGAQVHHRSRLFAGDVLARRAGVAAGEAVSQGGIP